MVIKVAIKKDNNVITWRDPYSAAIRNRLRVDLNLLDISNKEEALTNLGVKTYVNKRIGNIPWDDNTNSVTVKEYVDDGDNKLASKENEDVSNLQEQIDNLRRALSQTKDSLLEAISAILPVGSIIPFYGDLSYIPKDWKLCDGTNGTPDLRNRFLQGWGTRSAGNSVEAGIPNIKGVFGNCEEKSSVFSGAFTCVQTVYGASYHDEFGWNVIFDASTGSYDAFGNQIPQYQSVYGKSDTVQPASYVVYYIMKMK